MGAALETCTALAVCVKYSNVHDTGTGLAAEIVNGVVRELSPAGPLSAILTLDSQMRSQLGVRLDYYAVPGGVEPGLTFSN